MIPRALWHYLAAFYFAFQTLCAVLWWLLIWLRPGIRPLFRPSHTPDSALFAFFLPDAVLFIGAALWASVQLLVNPAKAKIPLTLHIGASVYAALYCVSQTALTGEAGNAAVSMTLCALCGAFLGFKAVSGD